MFITTQLNPILKKTFDMSIHEVEMMISFSFVGIGIGAILTSQLVNYFSRNHLLIVSALMHFVFALV